MVSRHGDYNIDEFFQQQVWLEKIPQMSITVAQKWFH